MKSTCAGARSKWRIAAVAEPFGGGGFSVPHTAGRGFIVAVIVAATTVAGGGLARASASESPSCSAGDTSHGPPSASIPPDLQPDFNCKAPQSLSNEPGRESLGKLAVETAKDKVKDDVTEKTTDAGLDKAAPHIKKASKGFWGAVKKAAGKAAKGAGKAAEGAAKAAGQCFKSGACEASAADDG
jgi:hypothetical protein